MGNALFIVWRESVEALLVIGILWAWLKVRGELARGRWYLLGGVVGGLLLAAALALAMNLVQDELAGAALDYFRAGMVLLASVLITQMVLWMMRHGRGMKRQLTAGAEAAFTRAGGLGLSLLVAIAVAREGAETAIFLYGLSFRATTVVLLLLACALLVAGVQQLIGLEALPPLVDPLWDSTMLLDDSHGLGNLLANFAGYRARPSLLLLLVVAGYWSLLFFWLRRPQPQPVAERA
jgi:high-affinity iron transporter